MEKITFECEIITPIFMYGGDGGTLELRPSEFKGMLRFWWRALHLDLSLKELKEEENKIFGSTDRKSGFRIVVANRNNLIKGRYFLLPHKESTSWPVFIPEHSRSFNIRFIFHNDNKDYIEKIKNLFIISTIIGGFGKRSRRGFGSIKINKIDEKDFDYDAYLSVDKLKELINSINSEFEFNFKYNEVNYPFIKKIEIGDKPYQSYDELLKHIGQMTHDCRCGKSGVFEDAFEKKKRFASPCYVSVVEKENLYFPIVTSLNIALPDNRNISLSQLININKFKNSILSKTKKC